MVRLVARLGVLAGLVVSLAAPASAATVYTGPGFDTCHAPSLATMQAWLASPYRAVGIYLGGVNRACPDGNLSASWTASAVALGWNLLPLYVGLQAPCVTQSRLALIDPGAAAAEGAAAADDAVSRAGFFGLAAGSPLYFDMEGYATNNPGCTQTVQTFLRAWAAELHARGYLAGVYGSASSTIRDLIPSAGDTVNGPDDVWIAHWNGQATVFGDSYVGDGYWPDHQRVHQYTGGHNETYGGVTLDIDSDMVDGAVVGPGGVAPPIPPQPQGGSVTTSDGLATVTWPAGAIPASATLTATPSTLAATVDGFAAGSYVVQLAAPGVSQFAQPVTVAFRPQAPALVPAYSADGTSWQPLPATVAADGSIDVTVSAPGLVGLLRDVAGPARPASVTGRLAAGRLLLRWQAPADNSGAVAGYSVLRDGRQLASAAAPSSAVRGFDPHAPTVFRVVALDAAGNASAPSAPVVVRPAARPAGLPRAIPAWAFQLAAWHHQGARPAAPRPLPAWYWRWQAWRLQPFRVSR